MNVIADLLLIGIVFIALIFASITDIKKKEVPNWLNFSLLAIALAIRGIGALIFQDFSYFYWALIAVAIFYVLSNLFYYGKVFGGGDAKLFIALAAILATRPYFAELTTIGEPFLMTFVINSLFLGSIWGTIFSIFLFIKFPKKKFFRQIRNLNKKMRLLRISCLIFALISLVFVLILNKSILIIVSIIFLILPYLYSFLKVIENNYLIKLIAPQKLVEGDSLFNDIRIKNKIIKKSVDGLSIEQIKLLRKIKKKVLIREGIVFVPILLIALIVSLFCGNLLLLIIQGILS
jgi:Flp pilus assembly protein protease CpaA